MNGGQFDLKGLAEWGVTQALRNTGLSGIETELMPMVGPILGELGIPHLLDIGIAGTVLGKVVIAGMDRQRAINKAHEEARRAEDGRPNP